MFIYYNEISCNKLEINQTFELIIKKTHIQYVLN
jgi:hypothetical protein